MAITYHNVHSSFLPHLQLSSPISRNLASIILNVFTYLINPPVATNVPFLTDALFTLVRLQLSIHPTRTITLICPS